MNCPACAHVNPEGARYCAQCGTRLSASCPGCKALLQAGQRFCTSCGSPQDLSPPTPMPAAVGASYTPPYLVRQALVDQQAIRGEKKQVTVLFCDLVDSTALASELGAEPMHTFLSQFFACALAEVHRYEGTVNQFLGDGFMAIFGAPIAFEDHAGRAGLAALAIRAALLEARKSSTPGWSRARVRMGLNSGQVVVGTIGDDLRRDYTAAGDTTHLAARLQAAAAPDEILCGEAVVEAAGEAMIVTALPPLVLKGLATPVRCYRLLDVSPNTTRVVHEQIPFVGRELELATLAASWRAACSGHGGILDISGEPGVGKSRLLREFRHRLGYGTRVVRAQCIPYGNQRPNVPVIELVRGLQMLTDPAPARDGASTAPSYLAALCGDPEGLESLRDMDPATVRGRTQQALASLLLHEAQQAPLLVCVEDLHWADPSSLDFLQVLTDALRQSRCLMIVTCRSGTVLTWPAGVRATNVRLSPLAAADVQTLLARLPAASTLPPAARQQLLTRAEGNPFFLEQLVRAASTSGAQVPGNVYDVLGARIDCLATTDKQLLRAAAVIGRQFPAALLAAIVDAPLALATLMDLGFVERTDDAGVFRFVHALAQEVAYDGMLSGARQQLHTAVAQHLAAEAPERESACEDIARHHLAGHSPALALPFLEAATAKAIRQHTLEAAYGYLQDALRLFDREDMVPSHVARCVVYLLQAFPVFHFQHKHREYAALLERFAPAVESLPPEAGPVRGAFLAQRGHRLWVEGRYKEAEATLLRAVDTCEGDGDTANAAHGAFMLAWLYANSARYAESEHYGQRSLDHLRTTPIPMCVTFANLGLMLAAVYRSDWEAARRHGEAARNAGRDSHDDGLASFGGAFLAWLNYERGDFDGAVREGREALALAPTQYFKGWAGTFMAAAMARVGDPAQALAVLEQSVSYAEQAGHVSGYALIALLRAEARILVGQYALAEREAQSLRALVATMPYPFVAAGALQVQAECAQLTGDAPRAASLFAAAVAEFDAVGASHRSVRIRSLMQSGGRSD